MLVSEQMINNLANLSKLSFTNDEKKEIGNDLENMIAFVNKLNELNVEGTSPLLHIAKEINIMREDEIKYFNTNDELLHLATNNDGVHIKVPKVIQKQKE